METVKFVGVVCPKEGCGCGRTRVVKTTTVEGQRGKVVLVERYHVCLKCGHRFKSAESDPPSRARQSKKAG